MMTIVSNASKLPCRKPARALEERDRMSKCFKVAVVQAASLPEDSKGSAAKAVALIEEAAREGGRLIVFPEAFIGGYPKGASFGTPVGMRKLEGRDAYQRYHGGA